MHKHTSWSNYKGGRKKVKCPKCGKVRFYWAGAKALKTDYCIVCYSKVYKPRPKERTRIKCKICKKVFDVKLSHKDRRRTCSKKCMAKLRSKLYVGKNHPTWRGGVRKYPLAFSRDLRFSVRYRDGNKCQLCSCPQEECIRLLAVHHIDYSRNNNNESNLITLCNSCHAKTQTNRIYWQNYFQKKALHIA